MFTQPTMYSIIKKHPNVLDIYGKKLVREADNNKGVAILT